MSKRVQDVAPPRSGDVKKWLKQNIAEQKKRHRAIMKEMSKISLSRRNVIGRS